MPVAPPFRVKISPQIRNVGIGQAELECRHTRAAVFYFGGDGIVAQRGRTLIKIFQQRRGLGVLVVTHPTFVEIYGFAATRAAIGHNPIGIQPQRALEIVRNDFVIGGLGDR